MVKFRFKQKEDRNDTGKDMWPGSCYTEVEENESQVFLSSTLVYYMGLSEKLFLILSSEREQVSFPVFFFLFFIWV